MDWGRGVVAALLTIPIVIAVAYMAVTHIDKAHAARPARARHRAA